MIRVEKRIGKDWAGVMDTDSREEADGFLSRHSGDQLRLVNGSGDVIAYPDDGAILQPGQAAPLPSSREGKRLREHGYTIDQKRDAREAHKALLDESLEALATPAGMSAFLVSREIHGDSLTAGNVALAAFQAPGQLVGTRAHWKREGMKLRKGQGHNLRLTGRSFWPAPAWTLESFGGEMPELPVPDAGHCETLARSWAEWPDHSVSGLSGWIADTSPALIEGDPVEVEREEVPIPF